MDEWVNRVHCGDALQLLRMMPDECVQMCVTSPPYWGLRDYGVGGQLGLEATPEEYVGKMVEVFREVRRVMMGDGVLWLNIGDSYGRDAAKGQHKLGHSGKQSYIYDRGGGRASAGGIGNGIKAKDLIGIPWMLAFALRNDGWYLRQDIIWHKPNPMPESVRDRCTKAHEYIFLLSKSERYYFDSEAMREESVTNNGGRNRRSVWTITTKPYKEAHFATFPPELITPCILAGSRPSGKRCDCSHIIASPTGTGVVDDPTMTTGRAGMNRHRRSNEGTLPVTRRQQREWAAQIRQSAHTVEMRIEAGVDAFSHYIRTDVSGGRPPNPVLRELWLSRGWISPTTPCDCPDQDADVVLDPFMGSGTTAMVASRHGRRWVGMELNVEYVMLAYKRLAEEGGA